MSFETLSLERPEKRVALLTFERPHVLNAMSAVFFTELVSAFEELDNDADIACCVLTGRGRAFSVGGDMNDLDSNTEDPEACRTRARDSMEALRAVDLAQTISIAAVNGYALGGGCELALVCDMALGGEAAQFGLPETAIGLIPGYGYFRAPEIIGRSWARRLAFSADTVDASDACRMGLIQEVVPDDELVSRALALASRIARNPRNALRAAKRLGAGRETIDISEAVEVCVELMLSEEHKVSVAEFAERRRNRGKKQ
jgi:enoyl-CoA hydratase